MRGRFGGVYFKTGPDGQHVQVMPRSVRYNRSPLQRGAAGHLSPFAATGIQGFSMAAYLFGLACIAAFSLLWAIFAGIYWFTTKTGEKKKITGYNWFIHYAEGYPEAHRPPLFQPPHTPTEAPSYIALYKDMWTYHHAPEDWPDECPSGQYYEGEIYNDRLSYKTDDFKWHLWWKDPIWVLSPGTGWEPVGMTFYSPGPLITDYYTNPVTGNQTHVYLGRPPG